MFTMKTILRPVFRHSFLFRRSMSRCTAVNRFFVYAPDRKDPDTHVKRHAVRPQHFAEIKPHIDGGTVQVAGMVLSSDQTEATKGQKKAEASMLIVKADTIDEVKQLIERDVYYTSGVWDTEKLIILPFVSATPLL
ncbi:hypothetical protein H2248_004979 [Termitomyces sp. 'cryptogamus']|nr:hypothetical protein H2248_004979 [Termitomyces sp. 'cryptogamus']